MRPIDADEFLQRALGTRCFRADFAIMLQELVNESTTLSPDDVRGVGCAYCKEDRDGYTMPLEKNAHAWVQYPNKLVIQFGKEIRKCEIKYCPRCGARMKGAEDGTTDNS